MSLSLVASNPESAIPPRLYFCEECHVKVPKPCWVSPEVARLMRGRSRLLAPLNLTPGDPEKCEIRRIADIIAY